MLPVLVTTAPRLRSPRMRCFLIFVGALMLALASAAHAGDRIDDSVAEVMTKRRIPGMAIAVIQNGKLIKAQGYGYADLERHKPVTSETVFQLASVTKQFVAAGVMILVQDGRVRTDAPIATYLDNLPAAWSGVTVRHLLTHTSGIENYLASPGAAKA